MKYLILLYLLFSMPAIGVESEFRTAKVKKGSYAEVNAKALKAILDAGVPITILDARPILTKGDNKIPRSIHLKSNASLGEIQAAIPSKQALIVVYCEDLWCPDDADLAAHLISLGYLNVIEYTPGMKDWIANHYAVEIVN